MSPAFPSPAEGELPGGQYDLRVGVVRERITPADFDGNGATDRAVFRPSTGVWFINGVGDAAHGA